jgi:hypothetical protein
MSSKLTLTIKDFPMRRASIGFKINSANIGQKFVGSTPFPKLIVTRQPDSYSSRFWVMATAKYIKPDSADSSFPQITITQDQFDNNGKFISGITIDFFDVVVETAKLKGGEEELTFLADRKSGEFIISNIEVKFD